MAKKIIGIDLGGTSVKFAILTQEETFKKNGLSRPTSLTKEATSFLISSLPSNTAWNC